MRKWDDDLNMTFYYAKFVQSGFGEWGEFRYDTFQLLRVLRTLFVHNTEKRLHHVQHYYLNCV